MRTSCLDLWFDLNLQILFLKNVLQNHTVDRILCNNIHISRKELIKETMKTAQLIKPIHGQSNQIALRTGRGVTLIDKPSNWTATAPEGCEIKLGDLVEYTNDNGAKFNLRVWGFANTFLHNGRGVYIFTDCYWYPADADSCKVIN